MDNVVWLRFAKVTDSLKGGIFWDTVYVWKYYNNAQPLQPISSYDCVSAKIVCQCRISGVGMVNLFQSLGHSRRNCGPNVTIILDARTCTWPQAVQWRIYDFGKGRKTKVERRRRQGRGTVVAEGGWRVREGVSFSCWGWRLWRGLCYAPSLEIFFQIFKWQWHVRIHSGTLF